MKEIKGRFKGYTYAFEENISGNIVVLKKTVFKIFNIELKDSVYREFERELKKKFNLNPEKADYLERILSLAIADHEYNEEEKERKEQIRQEQHDFLQKEK